MIRAVVDTSMLVRAVIKPRGTVGPVLRQLRNGAYLLLYSDPLLAEMADVLARPRLRAKYGLTSEDAANQLFHRAVSKRVEIRGTTWFSRPPLRGRGMSLSAATRDF